MEISTEALAISALMALAILSLLGLLIASASGLAGAGVAVWFLRKRNALGLLMDPSDREMVGILGRVTSPIHVRGVGEILYVRDGARKAAAARSEDAGEVPRGAEVIVTRYEMGIAYVRRWEEDRINRREEYASFN